MSYKIFTTAHDRVISGQDIPVDFVLDEKVSQGFDANIAEKHGEMAEIVVPDDLDEPVTLLIDCSGSTKGRLIVRQAAAVRAFGDAMTLAGKPFRVLGHTTSMWKGGQSIQEWRDQGRARDPGRLNDLLHIVFHDVDGDWSSDRDTLLKTVFKSGVLKENIDGEALAWAAEIAPEGRIVYMTDGVPMDDATMAYNAEGYLANHRNEVVEQLLNAGRELVTILEITRHEAERFTVRSQRQLQEFSAGYVEGAALIGVETVTPHKILSAISTAAFTPIEDLRPSADAASPGM